MSTRERFAPSPASNSPPSAQGLPDRVRLKCALERASAISEELAALSERQHEEVGKGYEPYAPNWGHYFALERMGALAIWTARTIESSQLVGYIVWIVTRGIHCRNTLIAEAKLIYLAPEWREGLTGFKFIKSGIAAIKAATNPDIVRIEINDLYEEGRLGTALLKRLGFERIGSVYRDCEPSQTYPLGFDRIGSAYERRR